MIKKRKLIGEDDLYIIFDEESIDFIKDYSFEIRKNSSSTFEDCNGKYHTITIADEEKSNMFMEHFEQDSLYWDIKRLTSRIKRKYCE